MPANKMGRLDLNGKTSNHNASILLLCSILKLTFNT